MNLFTTSGRCELVVSLMSAFLARSFQTLYELTPPPSWAFLSCYSSTLIRLECKGSASRRVPMLIVQALTPVCPRVKGPSWPARWVSLLLFRALFDPDLSQNCEHSPLAQPEIW